MNEMCTMKKQDGWRPEEDSNYDSGFKRQDYVENNANLVRAEDGEGNFLCDGKTLPH